MGLTTSPAGGASSSLAGNMLFVDAVNGSDTTAAVGDASKPYLTLGAAKAAGSSGQLIWVRPGVYTVSAPILKNGVNWYFSAGASVTMTAGNGATAGLLSDNNTAITCNVFGEGDFLVTLNGAAQYIGCVSTQNASSVVTVHARSIGATQGSSGVGTPVGVLGLNGTLKVSASFEIYGNDVGTVTDSGLGVYWDQGLLTVETPSLHATNNAVWISNTGSVETNLYVTADEIYTTGISNTNEQSGCITAFSGSNANGAAWIRAGIVRANTGSTNVAVFTFNDNANKVYVQCQKLFGSVQVQAGLVYVSADKSEAISNVTGDVTALGAEVSGGTLRYNVRQHDPKAFTGFCFLVDGGTFISNQIEYTSGSGSNGLSISSGTAHVNTAYLNTAANNAANPITKSGGTLVINSCLLVAEGSSDSIAAGSAQTVVAIGCATNRAKNANVTIAPSSGLTVDTNVV